MVEVASMAEVAEAPTSSYGVLVSARVFFRFRGHFRSHLSLLYEGKLEEKRVDQSGREEWPPKLEDGAGVGGKSSRGKAYMWGPDHVVVQISLLSRNVITSSTSSGYEMSATKGPLFLPFVFNLILSWNLLCCTIRKRRTLSPII